MLSENLPDRFVMEVTEDFGARISASGSGVEKLYIRRSNSMIQDGVNIVSAEMIGENLKGAEVHIYRPLGYSSNRRRRNHRRKNCCYSPYRSRRHG